MANIALCVPQCRRQYFNYATEPHNFITVFLSVCDYLCGSKTKKKIVRNRIVGGKKANKGQKHVIEDCWTMGSSRKYKDHSIKIQIQDLGLSCHIKSP